MFENTEINRAKYIAAHMGQNILLLGRSTKNTRCVTPSWMMYTERTMRLLLTPLSLITDEDAIEVSKILQVNPEDVSDWLNGDCTHEDFHGPFTFQHAIDYLRSKGYALPWMGLSVNELIKRNWALIKYHL